MNNRSDRFFSLVPGLGIALQSNFPPEEPVGIFLKKAIPPLAINQEKGQIFHPAVVQPIDEKQILVFFSLVTNSKENFRKLVFFSKHRAIAARFGEVEPFGFDKTRPGPQYTGRDYLSLRFPGPTGKFATVYFKIQPRNATPFYLGVDVSEEGGQIAVRARRIHPNACPRHLYFR